MKFVVRVGRRDESWNTFQIGNRRDNACKNKPIARVDLVAWRHGSNDLIAAVDLDQGHEDGYSSRGLTRALIGLDLDDAEADFQQALAIAPNESNAASWNGRILSQRGRFDDAYAAYERARQLGPANPARRDHPFMTRPAPSSTAR